MAPRGLQKLALVKHVPLVALAILVNCLYLGHCGFGVEGVAQEPDLLASCLLQQLQLEVVVFYVLFAHSQPSYLFKVLSVIED